VAAADEALIPLYGFLEGDTLGLVILARGQQRIGDLANVVLRSAAVRVAPREGARVFFAGQALDDDQTVARAGLTPLDRIDVRFGEPPPAPTTERR
jgi:hypothetical protein